MNSGDVWQSIKSAESLLAQFSKMGIQVDSRGMAPVVDMLGALNKAEFMFQLSAEAAQIRVNLRSGKLSADDRAAMEGEAEAIEETILHLHEEKAISYSVQEIEQKNQQAFGQVIDMTNAFRKRAESASQGRQASAGAVRQNQIIQSEFGKKN